MAIRISLILLSSCAFLFSECNAIQNEEIEDGVLYIEGQILSLGEHNICKLDLGNVESGERLLIEAKLTSKTAKDLSFNSVSTSCRCTSVTPKAGEIPAFGTIQLRIRLDVPKANSSARFPAGFHLISDDGSEITVNLFMGIANNLYIAPNHQFAVSKAFRTVIPVEISEPILFENLRLDVSENFDGVAEFSLVNKEGQPGIQVSADKSKFSSEYVSGKIKIHDAINLKSIDSDILFRTSQPVSISPKIIQFHQSSNASEKEKVSGAQVFEAKALMRIDSDTFQKFGRPRVRCTVDDKSCETKVIKLTQNLYRVKLSLSLPSALPGLAPLVWELEGRRSLSIEGAAMFR